MELEDNKADDSENKLYKERRQRTLIPSLFFRLVGGFLCECGVHHVRQGLVPPHLQRRIYRIQNISP
jgi:hypothetical protein